MKLSVLSALVVKSNESLLQLTPKHFLKLLHFRFNYILAIRLRTILVVIALMIILCGIKISEGCNLSNNWSIKHSRFI